MDSSVQSFKIIILGDGRVGKTTLRKRFFGEKFQSEYMMTLGADFAVKRIQHKGKDFVLHFWDMAGQPHFKDVRKNYYTHVSGVVMVFDLTSPESFRNIPNWIEEFKENSTKDSKDVALILVGNKLDLRGDPDHQCIAMEEGLTYSKTLSDWSNLEIPYFETSALVGLNIDSAFKALIDKIDESYSKND